MKKSRWLVAPLLVLAASSAVAAMEGNVLFLLGQRGLDDVWEPVDSQGTFGVQVDFGASDWPVHVALGAYFSAEEKDYFDPDLGLAAELRGAVAELSTGAVWHPLKEGGVRPYLGGGILFGSAAVEASAGALSVDDDDQSLGFYVNGGVFFKLGSRFLLGADVRVVRGTQGDFFGAEGNADYEQLGLNLGFSFGGK